MGDFTSSSLGKLEYDNSDVVNFVKPILGFEHLRKFLVVCRPESEPLRWLQSLDDPDICFVILEPQWVLPGYEIEISQHDIKTLDGSTDQADYQTYLIITIPRGKPEDISANLKGPVVINRKNLKAIQMVLSNPDYEIQFKFVKKQGAVSAGDR